MTSLFFWNSWVKEYRIVWYALAAAFVFALGFMWYSYAEGTSSVIEWQKLQEQKVIDAEVHSFRLGPFVLNVPGESYIILEHLHGSSIQPNETASYIFLAVVFLAVVVILTIITTLERMWYYVAMGVFIVFLVTLRFEVLGLLGLYNKFTPAIIVALYVVPAFYFNRFRPTTPFVIRLLTFLGITAAVAAAIGFLSNEPLPYYHLVLTSFTGSWIMAILFMIIVAHEIFAGFVYLVTRGSTRSLQHFLILYAIYFINVLLTLLNELGFIRFDFIFINLFLLLTISSILGIWGFKNREPVYENILPFNPLGAFLFLALGTICFATIGHQLGNGNDPGILVLRHAILFSHAAYGLIFLFYVLSNFGQLLSDNGAVFKVLYKPIRMPYFTYALAGFISMVAIVIYANWRSYVYNSFSAFYNTAGDFYALQDNEVFSKAFYQKAANHGVHNHRSNYALASINTAANNFEGAHENYEAANALRATEYSLANSANLFVRESDFIKGISEYQRNLKKLPSSAALLNNLGVAYIKRRNYDSAVFYLSKAREQQLTKTSAETNFFGLAAAELLPLKADSIYKTFNNPSPATLSNVYALASVTRSSVNLNVDPLAEKQLDLYTATLLNNYIILNAKKLDSAFTNKAFRIASAPENIKFSEALKASLAFAYYHQGNIAKALEILAEQVYLSQSYQGKFNYIMGLWALEQNNGELAASYFNYADTYDYKDAPFYHAIALTEAGFVGQALVAWDSVTSRGDGSQKAIAQNIRRILTIPVDAALSLPDEDKYQYCRYRIPLRDSTLFTRFSNSFENPNYKAQALLEYSERLFDAGYITPAIRMYQRIAGLKMTDKKLYDHVRFFELRLLAARGDMRGVANQINKGIEFTQERNLEKMYYTALMSEVNGDTLTARKHYEILGRHNPYFEDGILAAYNYFRSYKPGFYAYNILAEAIQVNANSVRLLRAYYDESLRMGLEEYAASTAGKIQELEARERRKQ
jgi:hypothetical protein